tara:strand:+ start:847 stop:1074 length:228 start_codon:yes stop_codon:yes gene_type:complete
MSKNKIKRPIEDSLIKLESIINKMESGNISLEESLAYFEQGINLINECRTKLENAEQKVLELTKNSDGTFRTKTK